MESLWFTPLVSPTYTEAFTVITPLLVGLLGLLLGSFATAVVYRVPRGEQFVSGRSKCPHCKHPLSIIDLFPLLSWLWLRGKCRYCNTSFGGGYPLVELSLSAMCLMIYFQLGITLLALLMVCLATTLIILIAIDFEYYIIPDGTNLTLLILGIIYRIALDAPWQYFIIAPLCGFALGMALRWGIYAWKRREGLGLGDVKFLIGAALFIDPLMIDIFLFLSGVIGMLTAIIWRILGKGERFPFGPALASALFIVTLYPEIYTHWQGVIQSLIGRA